MRPVTPKFDLERITQDIATQSREPFRNILCRLLELSPGDEALEHFATRHPHKWVKAINNMAKLSGYKDGSPSGDTNIFMQINNLPDSALMQRLKETLDAIKSYDTGNLITLDGQKNAV